MKAKLDFSKSCAAIALACFAVIVVIWGVTYERITFERADDIDEAIRRNNNLAVALEEHTIRTLRLVDQSLLFLKLEYEAKGAKMRAPLLATIGQADPSTYTFLAVVDARGDIVVSMPKAGPKNLGDRDYFDHHRRTAGAALHIAQPRPGRVTGRTTIQVSRRVDRADGSFGGVVVAGINPEYFAKFYNDVEHGEGALVQLVALSGVVLARTTASGAITGQDMRDSTLLKRAQTSESGSFLSVGRLDGVVRYQSYRVLREFGLVVAVGQSEREVLADSRERLRMYLIGSSAATLFVILFGAGLIRAMRRQKRATDAALAGEALFRATFEQAAIGIAHCSPDGRFLRANGRYCDMLGYSEAELRQRGFQDVLHPADLSVAESLRECLIARQASTPSFEHRELRKDGQVLCTSVSVAMVRDAAGRPDYFVAMVQDVTERKKTEQELSDAERRYRTAFEGAGVGIIHTALDGKLLRVNHKMCAMLGYSDAELRKRHFVDVTHPEDRELSRDWMKKILASTETPSVEFEKRYLRRDSSVMSALVTAALVRDTDGKPDYFVTMIQDVSARKEAQARLEHQAHHDTLTDLPNRVLLLDRLAQTLNQSRRKNWDAAVLFVDLDRFKSVNDTLGHDLGDLLLKEAARRLVGSVRSEDTVARVGGDEFVVVLCELGDASDAARVARKIGAAMARPFLLEGHEVFVTASIGIAMFPGDGNDGETLIKNADVAMFRAKEAGRNSSEFYAATMNEKAMEKLQLESDLRRAVERNELLLHFQPKVNIAGRKVEGFEALLRWNRAGNGLVSPAVFVPLLEDSGMIVPVGEWVIRAACAQIREWRLAGLMPVPVAVNVSAKQFLHGNLSAVIERALQDYGVGAGLLQIEITESDAMQDPERAIRVLGQLKARGIAIAIDDFGTGYSSLGYLKRFPIDLLKLDRSFVTGLPNDSDDVSIARAVIGMAHSLDLKVIAEGVETEEQRAFLANNGCNQMQGYLFSRPVPAAQCASFLGVGDATASAERKAA